MWKKLVYCNPKKRSRQQRKSLREESGLKRNIFSVARVRWVTRTAYMRVRSLVARGVSDSGGADGSRDPFGIHILL